MEENHGKVTFSNEKYLGIFMMRILRQLLEFSSTCKIKSCVQKELLRIFQESQLTDNFSILQNHVKIRTMSFLEK